MRLRVVALVAAFITFVALVGLAALIVAMVGAEAPPTAAVVPVKAAQAPRPTLPALPGRSAPKEPDEAHPASVYEVGHVAVAEALGLVAIRCWVGPEWDTEDLVGAYQQRISNGWYTNVEERLVGSRGVEKRFQLPDVPPDAPDWEQVDFETLFVVSWRAERPGTQVPCEVHTLDRAALRVRVTDPDGAVVSGATVYGCGSSAESDADGVALLEEAHASSACALMGYSPGTLCNGSLDIAALAPDEERSVDLRLACVDAAKEDSILAHLQAGESAEAEVEQLPSPSNEQALATYQELRARGLGDGADALLDNLIARRKRLMALIIEQEADRARRDEQSRRMDVLMEQIEATSDPAEVQALFEELQALMREMFDDVRR